MPRPGDNWNSLRNYVFGGTHLAFDKFTSHAAWMAGSHHRDGDKALISYDLTKGPELSNPLGESPILYRTPPTTAWPSMV